MPGGPTWASPGFRSPSPWAAPGLPAFEWDSSKVTIDGHEVSGAAMLFVFPSASGRLNAVFTATLYAEYLLLRHFPFSSRSAVPDYMVWVAGGLVAAGFFDPTWTFDRMLGVGPW